MSPPLEHVSIIGTATADVSRTIPCRFPHGTKNALGAAKTDPNISCAVAVDAVHRHFGTKLRPIVMGQRMGASGCAFVEPEHAVVVHVWLNEPVAGTQPTTVAGHAAMITQPASPETPYSISVSLSGDDGLATDVQYLQPRGTKDAGTGVVPDKPVPLRPLLVDILNRYFT